MLARMASMQSRQLSHSSGSALKSMWMTSLAPRCAIAAGSRDTSSPSNSGAASWPRARKLASICALTVLPNRRGRVMQIYPPVAPDGGSDGGSHARLVDEARRTRNS